MESDIYRTKDGKAQFSFNFIETDGLYEIEPIHIPREIKQETLKTHCILSENNNHIIFLDSKPHDIHTARLLAGDWAEIAWEQFQPSSHTKLVGN